MNVVAGVLSEPAPHEEVAELESGREGKPVEAPSFAFGENNEGELPTDMLVEQPLSK